MIRIEEVKLRLDEDDGLLKQKISAILALPESEIESFLVVKKNIDSRQRNIFFVYSLDVILKNPERLKHFDVRHRVRVHTPFVYKEKKLTRKIAKRPVIVGSGPCGLFAALLLVKAGARPIIIERGKAVDERVKDVDAFFLKRELNPESNIQFGEGGAGTFSDGKLYTLINDPRSQYIFDEMVKAGAPADIKTNAAPHIGTDKLRGVIKNMRKEIIRLGGDIRFGSCLTDLIIKNERIEAIVINNNENILVDDLILAVGHSARDTYAMLFERGLKMTAKPFAIGLRIEHEAEMINKARYGNNFNHPKLGTAKYKLVQHLPGLRSVYTFCMCPGGYVVAAASEAGGVVTNGMSEFAQDGKNSNSALLVPVTPADFESDHPLSGVEFQRRWEKAAFALGGGDYSAPVQLVGDFLKNKSSIKTKSVVPSYRPGVVFTSLCNCLPDYAIESLRMVLPQMDKKLKGFAHSDAVLTGVETRSSSPLRILRNEKLEANISGIYPSGEGAGYAGGIVSSAIDGLRVAEEIIEKYLV
ncbi:MAG: FAD dependent oxidoreductase [Candidatus Falkowbacteria bacterium GW2011_GWC2_38_22]|uniref:FAD dependent oxidoreductase n=1 Tax=Candidatus Falkowbacteria bacterium GW2011_GWE1_38_31 TaxID=1618638 RepID=A0A0G0N1B0_9BACT|nr:MAG: FAD dependent oxidoreductase [Candidatus Falkowbacteria bacterium GW2011_GWF2_38_1205]KKQ62076.1 MAG: FAD dependent oxidoreductase [Candidatus Falkowbacteria bacterium GW2011_GWC2_38_22]KKQ64226.1 MAG: FAD dependent oxidoreductase [Candidatus Falkowbacteria bacterium GW2011_GWF1_38_22]KKQ66203.1 MAG: FAD dependent oxidoreductase [Candidatus Falkowbacteria bacterium GW2011_GWE2_38_254]KKQ70931.1 MAG: FAD dependent oxidoreductase [Candidatus Falkowbacteria bacterium GW2011_GWE1_38_31]KKQ